MTRRKSVDPIGSFEPMEPVESVESSESEEPLQLVEDGGPDVRVFDFLQPVELMDAETKNVYYRLRRFALTAQTTEFEADKGRGDASLLPDGKVYEESQVIEILGEDYLNGLVVDKKCCG